MCGIAGFFANQQNSITEVELRNAMLSLKHRGPDSQGVLFGDNFGLAHTRLSIQDLTERASQPFVSACGRYTMVYNGEVYNYKDLATKYQLTLKSNSDTEVVIELFAKLGMDHVYELNGFFSYVIHDKEEESFFLFRDRAGVKPLFYYYDGDVFCFASEIKSLLDFDIVNKSKKISRKAIKEFLHLGFISRDSIYENIHQLPAGYFGKVNKNGFFYQHYWKVENLYTENRLRDEEEAIRKLDELMVQSVRYRMVSDVPVGVFLSGGIDSSLIAAIAARESRTRIDTFTIGFEDPKLDESIYARKIAQRISSRHHEWIFKKEEILDKVSSLPSTFNQPFANSTALPLMMLSYEVSKQVKVALSGEGSDELFGGYGSSIWADRLDNSILREILKLISPVYSALPSSRYKRVGKLLQLPQKKHFQSHLFSQEQYFFSLKELDALLIEPVPELEDFLSEENCTRDLDLVELQSLFEFKHYLSNDLLVNLDRCSMKNSLEAREPYLDHQVVQFAANLHPALKFRNGEGKYILKKVLYKYLPENLFQKPKWGFALPMDKWLKNELRFMIDAYLNEDILEKHKFVNASMVKKWVNDFLKKENYSFLSNRIWALIVLHQWAEEQR